MQKADGRRMIFFLTSHSLWLSATLVVVLTTALASFGPWLVRRYVKLEKLTTNNEIAGFKFATIGVLYAVLLAFAVIVVWEKFSNAEVTVAQEAGGATTIYRLAPGLGDQAGAAVRDAMSNYVRAAIARDWPAMESHNASEYRAGTMALDAVYATLLSVQPSTPRESATFSEILRQLDVVTQARRARLVTSEGIVPEVIWPVMFGGAILTIVFTFFFGTKNLRAQTAMTALLSLLVFSELLIIIVVDYPFTGPVQVEPTALAQVLADFAPAPGSATK
ncbi:MAG: DUF4239 domain-containing protein [Xanthobacteraceae bacterium]